MRHARVVGRTLKAVTIGVGSAAERERVKRVAAVFALSEGTQPTLPEVWPDEVTRDGTLIELHGLESRDGNVSLLELAVLARLVRERAPQAIFEIGTFDGRTTLNLAANAPGDAQIYTLDLPPDQPTAYALAAADYAFVNKPSSGARLRGTALDSRVTQLYGDSATFDFSPYRADFVFVDGSHAYEYVLSDSDGAMRLIGDGPGTIVWHDYAAWDGVTRGLQELRERDSRYREMRRVRGTSLVVLHR